VLLGYKIQEDEMGKIYSTHEKDAKCMKKSGEKCEGKIRLKWILKR
jgi:hypothetical protein